MSMEPCAAHKLDGQVAVVTGAAQGLGLAIAEQLARSGATVTLADLQLEKATAAAAGLVQQGLAAKAAHLDVTDGAEVDALLKDTARHDGRLDILVNAAGVGQTVMPTVDLPDAEWARVLGVNLTGTFHGCRAAGAIMELQDSGCIVNIASINGQNPAALVAAYNVAKAGVIMLTRSLALEMAPYHVRVNAVSPGPVYTDFNKSVMAQRRQILNVTEEQMIENIRKAVPLGRWGEPDDIAQAVAFLCSPAAAWITGEVFRISGGMEGVSAAPARRARQ